MEHHRPNPEIRDEPGGPRCMRWVLRALRTPWTGVMGPVLLVPLLLAAVVAPASVPGAPDVPDAHAASGDAPTRALEGEIEPTPATPAALMERRLERLEDGLEAMEGRYESRVAPIERTLRRFSDDPELVRRIAFALVREGESVGIDPRVLVSVLLVENPWLDPEARSFVGATGLMQVMPFHAGQWGCGSDDLSDLDSNICHGARIFARYFEQTDGDVARALLRYNGCVRGTNTPDCHTYPYHVYARAGEAVVHGLLLRERGP